MIGPSRGWNDVVMAVHVEVEDFMRVELETEFILQMYCFTFQGERSIAFSLGAPWEEVRAFYLGRRLALLEWFAAQVDTKMKILGLDRPALKRDELGPYWPEVGFFGCIFSWLMAPRKRHWSFDRQALVFMASALASLIRCLKSDIRPSQESLISLRIDLCMSRTMIEDRCPGWQYLGRVRQVEHFWKSPWMPVLKIEEILSGLPLRDDSSVRKSA
jgi:hypothetical protein